MISVMPWVCSFVHLLCVRSECALDTGFPSPCNPDVGLILVNREEWELSCLAGFEKCSLFCVKQLTLAVVID